MRIESLKYLKIILIFLVTLYFFVEYQYEGEILIFTIVLISFIIIHNGISFSKKEKDSIELGQKENFKSSHWFMLLFLAAFLVFIFYGIPKMNELDLFPESDRKLGVNVSFLILVPQMVELFMGLILSEMKAKYYATEVGLLKSLEPEEEMKWEDFYSFKLIESHNIIRFEKKNLKYFFIKYEEEYFNEYREEILSFLEKKLPRK